MDIEIRPQELAQNAWLVRVGGTLDTETYPRFEERLGAIASKAPRSLLLSMEDVKYISSSGLGALFRLKRHFDQSSGFFGIYDASIAVRRVLEISKSGALLVSPEVIGADSPFFPYVSARETEKRKEAEARARKSKPSQRRSR